MSEHALTLRPALIGGESAEGDFSVRRDGRTIGRIRRAQDHVQGGAVWSWSITVPLPVPSWASGGAGSLESAKIAFREAWERFYAGLTEQDIALWHRTQDARSR